jgi:hypothetical protein
MGRVKDDMAQMGIVVNVVSDTTVKDLNVGKIINSFVSGAYNIVAATSLEDGNRTSASGPATNGFGKHFVGALLNEDANNGDHRLMTREVLHYLNNDYGAKNPNSIGREWRVDRQTFKLEHPWIIRHGNFNFQPYRDAVWQIP